MELRQKCIAIVVAVSAIAFVGTAIWQYTDGNDTHTVVRTADGFTPETLIVSVGDAVIFISDAGDGFWPASDYHPTHQQYTAFDPRRELADDETWKFTFDTAGTWTFHDHLSPSLTGTILVLGEDSKHALACSKVEVSTTDVEKCWLPELTRIIEERGMTAAFDFFAALAEHEPGFKPDCHDVGHVLGEKAFEYFTVGKSDLDHPATAYCGYGFYHGFIEAALQYRGLAEQKKRARAYCDSLRRPGVSSIYQSPETASCYHGIGHALFDSIQGDLWGDATGMYSAAVEQCEATTPITWHRKRCAAGAANALANAYSASWYNLSFPETVGDVEIACQSQKTQYYRSCYAEVLTSFIRYQGANRDDVFDIVEQIKTPIGREGLVFGFLDDEIRWKEGFASLASIRDYCLLFSDDSLVQACVEGAVTGLRIMGAHDYGVKRARSFCSLVDIRVYCEKIPHLPNSILTVSS